MLLFPPPVKIDEGAGFKGTDIFFREHFGKSLARLAQNADDALVIGLDAPWGEGKTTFIKQWMGLLASDEFGINSIYFDAFENDYQDDPLSSLTERFYSFIEKKADLAEKDSFWTEWKPSFIESVGKNLTEHVGTLGKLIGTAVGAGVAAGCGCGPEAEAIGSGMSTGIEEAARKGEVYLRARQKIRAGREGFHNTLKEIGARLKERTRKPLVFIIDELDRCRPDFALNLLESVKHVFSVPGIVFVLVFNGQQMRGHISCRYGDKVDAGIYLNKFISINVFLPKATSLRQKSQDDGYRYILNLTERMEMHLKETDVLVFYARKKKLSLREIERWMTLVGVVMLAEPKEFTGLEELVGAICLTYILDEGLFRMLQAGEMCWDQFSCFFEFDSITEEEKKYYYLGSFIDICRNMLNLQDKESPFPFSQPRNRYILLCCRALTNFCPNS